MKIWHDALNTQAIAFKHKPSNAQETAICELTDLSLWRVSGEDTQDFLQNQFTNDLRLLNLHNSQNTAWCTPKGRVLVTFRAYKQAGAIYLCLARDLAESILKRLRMYIFRSKVEIEDISNNTVLLGLTGEKATALLEAEGINAPTDANAITPMDDENSVICLSNTVARYLLMLRPEKAAALLPNLSTETKACTLEHWHYLTIMSTIPHISAATTETWTPQMLSYDLLDGVSFKKGCYPGQEVVARTHYLGKAKRRLAQVEIASSQTVTAKTEIVDGTGKAQGQIVNAASNPQRTISALAVLRTDADDSNLQLQGDENAAVSVQKRIV